MTAFYGHTFPTQHEKFKEQVKELQHAIKEKTYQLEEIQQKRLHDEEEIIQWTRETERRVELMMGKSEVVDMLQQLGHLLQKESQLSEQLNGPASVDRNQWNDLQEKNECVTKKARSLAAEILEVKQSLAESKARNMAAQPLIHAPTSKSKRNQRKAK